MTHAPQSEAQKQQTLLKIIRGIRTAFLVTRNTEGGMHARPMACAEVEDNLARLWFATSLQSAKVHELNQDDRVLCTFSNPSGSDWATINGRARLVTDRSRIEQLWSPFWRNWFEGPEDPQLALIEVIPETAEYWESASRIITAVKLAIAAMTGSKMNEGENQTVHLNRGN